MFYDCLRCGAGFRYVGDRHPGCVCKGMTDEQAAYVKALHEACSKLRAQLRKAGFEPN